MDVIWEGPQRAFIRHVDVGDGTHAVVASGISESAFYRGREFKTFYEFSIPTGQSLAIRTVLGADTIFQEFFLEIESAKLKFEWFIGGTAAGTWNNTLPVIRTNTTSNADTSYNSQLVLTTGGTFTGGTRIDVFALDSGDKVKSGGAAGAEAHLVGLPPSTNFIKLTNTDGTACVGIFKALWDER